MRASRESVSHGVVSSLQNARFVVCIRRVGLNFIQNMEFASFFLFHLGLQVGHLVALSEIGYDGI